MENQGQIQVDLASSAKEAHSKLNKKKFDVIVSDYQMPIKNGLQFLKELKEKDNNTPFILFTGKGREEVAIQALNLGANRYINKIGKPETVYGELAYAIIQEAEKHRSKQLLIESEEKYRVLIERAADGVAILQDNLIKFSNKSLAEMLGYKQEELINNEFEKLIPPENQETLLVRYKKRIAGNRIPAVYEIPVFKKNGKKIMLEISTALIQYEGQPASMAVIRNITERKKTEEILKKSEKKYRNIVERAPSGIATLRMNGRVTSVNQAFLNLTGFSEHEIVGKHFTKLGTLRTRDMPKYIKIFTGFLRGKLPPPFEFVYYRKDGTQRYGEAHLSYIKKDQKNIGIQAILLDITERKKAEDNFRSEKYFIDKVINEIDDTFFIFDPKTGKAIQWNTAFKKISGYNNKEIRSLKAPTSYYSEEDLKRAKETIKKIIKNGRDRLEMSLITKDGRCIPFEYAGVLVKSPKGKNWICAIGRNLSDRKKVDNALICASDNLALVNEKLDVIGKLTRHDISNKITIIRNNVHLAIKRVKNNKIISEYLKSIESATNQTDKIFEFAKNYEKLGLEDMSFVNVGFSLKEARMLLSGLDGINLVNECDNLEVMADSLLIEVFYNLLDNSIKHAKNVDQIKLYYIEGNNNLSLIYEDNGNGISEGEKEKIFKEGYGKGTGYGLFLIRKICDSYNWIIKETGKQSKGAQFTIIIPKTNEKGEKNYNFLQ